MEQDHTSTSIPSTVSTSQSSSVDFSKSTVEMIMRLQPDDGNAAGRKITYAIRVNNKPLRIASLRTEQLPMLFTALAGYTTEQFLEIVATYVNDWQQKIKVIGQQINAKTKPSATTKPPAATTSSAQIQPSLLEATAANDHRQEKASGSSAPTGEAVMGKGTRPELQRSPAPEPQPDVEQLTLF